MSLEGGRLPPLCEVEREHIIRVLRATRGNQRRAARILGISRWSMSRRLTKHGIEIAVVAAAVEESPPRAGTFDVPPPVQKEN